ncbi:hypothetical protein POM88_048003 [Heracleum sosnowskyi]|uniref:Uncharacterized protein n=1 Tax=Heracleum sosnowskyi TaxID=360622 RepID=A0AAD8GUW4_9APIA|nr:hypothetical protein POM88_048003 [Heracleum sosnowskyi]
MSAFLPNIPKAPCMKKFSPSRTFQDSPDVQQGDQTSLEVYPQSSLGDLVNCDFDSCSETEMKELKDKFIMHAETSRSFIKQIEARELELDRIEDAELRKQGNFVKKSGNKITGQKRAMTISPDREIKRSKTMEVNSTETPKVEGAMMRKCGAILRKLMHHKNGWVFNKPVNAVALRLPNYHKIIKRPMDLGTVKSKLGEGVYGTPLDFAEDVRLTFDNAILYNLEGDDVHTMATVLLDLFEKLFYSAYEKNEVERQRVIVEQRKCSKPLAGITRDDRKKALCGAAPLVKVLAAKNCEEAAKKSVSKTQWAVPEVNENSRMTGNMSDWEKYPLARVLKDLAGKYLDEILQIVVKRSPEMMTPDEDGIVELDFLALDNETLWDLHKFVRLKSNAKQNEKVI